MNASSESGLCATVISRTGEDTVLIRFRKSCSINFGAETNKTLARSLSKSSRRDAASRVSHLSVKREGPSLRGGFLPPATSDCRSHQDLNDFRKNKPVKTIFDGKRSRVCEHSEPT